MPNIKKHRYASILLSRFFNMRLSNRALINKPLSVYIESTSHPRENMSIVMPPTTQYNPRSVLSNAAPTHRLINSPHTSAYSDRPYVATMFRKIRRLGDIIPTHLQPERISNMPLILQQVSHRYHRTILPLVESTVHHSIWQLLLLHTLH